LGIGSLRGSSDHPYDERPRSSCPGQNFENSLGELKSITPGVFQSKFQSSTTTGQNHDFVSQSNESLILSVAADRLFYQLFLTFFL
jgi:hypothetical protein